MSKHDARMTTDEWKRQFWPMTREGTGPDWQPKPLTAEERRVRLERFADQRVTSKAGPS